MQRAAALALAAVAAAFFAAPAPAAEPILDLRPLTATPKVENCIPLGSTSGYGFNGIIYRNVPSFTLHKGDTIAFDLGKTTTADVHRDIWFAAADQNPTSTPPRYGYVVSEYVKALGWTQVVSATQTPQNPRGDNVIGDYELKFRAEHDFTFGGGGFVVGFGGTPWPGIAGVCEANQVMVVTNYRDPSALFYARFYLHSPLTSDYLDWFWPQPVRADQGELWGMLIEPAPTYLVDVTTFIPGDHVIGPPQSRCGHGQQLWFAGDARGFDPDSDAYRTNEHVYVVPDARISPSGIADGTEPVVDVGATKAYAPDALDDGVIDARDDDAVLGDCHLLHAIGYASTDGLHVDVQRVTPEVVSVHFTGSASNPLVPVFAAAIDWDITVTVDSIGGTVHVTADGTHDGFPAYEIYVNDKPVYTYSPGPPPYDHWTDLLGLFPGHTQTVHGSASLP